MCTDFEINRYKSYELIEHAKMVCHVTQKRYVVRHGGWDTSDRYFDQEHFETNRFKSYGSNSGFHVFGDLDLKL